MLAEPWNSLLYLVAIPLVVQIIKVIKAKSGKPLPVGAIQAIAAVLAAVFVYLNGGFAGLELPIYAGDPIGYVSALLGLLVVAWGPIELLYRVIYKAIFEKVGLV